MTKPAIVAVCLVVLLAVGVYAQPESITVPLTDQAAAYLAGTVVGWCEASYNDTVQDCICSQTFHQRRVATLYGADPASEWLHPEGCAGIWGERAEGCLTYQDRPGCMTDGRPGSDLEDKP